MLSAILIVLIGLVLIAWFTQVIRLLDFVVVNGRSVIEFLGVTMLLLPLIVALIMPTALFFATIFVLDRMNGDSELAIISAAGVSRWWLLRPFLAASAIAVAAALVATLVVQPGAMRELRQRQLEIRSDLMSSLIDEGQFSSPRHGLMIHVKGKGDEGELAGIIFEDSRVPEAPVTYLARVGRLVKQAGAVYLLLTDGTVVRTDPGRPTVSLVHFDAYSLSLSGFFEEFGGGGLKPQEMYLGELLSADATSELDADSPQRLHGEAHGRLSNPLYTLVAMLIAFAALCDPRTTRRGRVWAIVIAALVAGAVRVAGFVLVSAAGKSAAFVLPLYAIPLAAIACTVAFMALRDRSRGTASQPPFAAGRRDLVARST